MKTDACLCASLADSLTAIEDVSNKIFGEIKEHILCLIPLFPATAYSCVGN
jgi:hypothetical protein